MQCQQLKVESSQGVQPIAVYLGRNIFLSYIPMKGADKGRWLHWYHPDDAGRPNALKYGHFWAPNQSLEEVLHEIYQVIDATLELEMQYQKRMASRPYFLQKACSKLSNDLSQSEFRGAVPQGC